MTTQIFWRPCELDLGGSQH